MVEVEADVVCVTEDTTTCVVEATVLVLLITTLEVLAAEDTVFEVVLVLAGHTFAEEDATLEDPEEVTVEDTGSLVAIVVAISVGIAADVVIAVVPTSDEAATLVEAEGTTLLLACVVCD